MSEQIIEKVLSANDTGETGGHQAGILVPKNPGILDFFPRLDRSTKNPRKVLDMCDVTGHEWTFVFIYYNNRFFGGTRNEYRLTGMTAFLREFNLKVGDILIFRRVQPHSMFISFKRTAPSDKVLKLTDSWKVITADF